MKKNLLALFAFSLTTFIWSCNNSTQTTDTKTDSSTTAATPGASDTSNKNNSAATPANSTAATAVPVSKDDSSFMMEAAAGNMEEVQMGNLAQQKGNNQRVKDFGAMMVRDHSKALDELKNLASGKGITVPSALPAAKQKDVDMMQKMSGKSFDQHYVSMMLDDHKKDVAKFKKESEGAAKDPDLKNWAGKTLPVLQTHLDSIQAISKSKL
jgi:putative membrane protein